MATTPASESGAGRYASMANHVKTKRAQAANPDVVSVTTATPEQIAAAQRAGDQAVAEFEAAQKAREAAIPAEAAPQGAEGGKREIECPYCNGSVLVKTAGRIFQSISAFLQRSFHIRIPTALLEYLKEKLPVEKFAILKEPCAACDGKRKIEDPTDDRDRWEAAKAIADGYKEEIQEMEARLAPPCGNRYTIIQGCDLLEVGLGMNDAPSYRVDREKGIRNKGLIDPGKINTKKGGPQIPEGAKANHVQGINPPASPGGHYVIKCSNRFTLVAGAQGIDLTTGGPITINGGITQITGPEVTIGTQTGRCVIEGESVALNGKSVEVSPTDGHMFVKGTMSASGNLMVGGHAHCESASITKLETTGRNEPSKPSAPSNIYGGPAFWGSIAVEGIIASLKELSAYVLTNMTNPEHAKLIISPRFFQGIQDNVTNILYTTRPIELVPTGVALIAYGSSAGLHFIFNFPHVHAMPDQMHVHETRVPDIKCDADSAEELRKSQSGVAGPAPLQKTNTKLSDVLVDLWSVISTVFVPAAKPILENNYNK